MGPPSAYPLASATLQGPNARPFKIPASNTRRTFQTRKRAYLPSTPEDPRTLPRELFINIESDASSVMAAEEVLTPSYIQPRRAPLPPPSLLSSSELRPSSPGTEDNSFRTRYMSMLLSLDTIPRVHNILASVFTWLLLAGFVVFPGTFTSRPVLKSLGPAGAEFRSLALLIATSTCCTAGLLGMLWLSLRWRRNYVWLLNRLYLPGVLNALAGLLATLAGVYAQQQGHWSVPALTVAAVEAAVLVSSLVCFVVYNNLLLEKVRRHHQDGAESGTDLDSGRTSKFGRVARDPAIAPGSVV
ncbi:hypothetical protein NKR23_g7823 [Pleurostoma richardsiae]|uniref:Uncharacterized protein n=1 Tax=Pleurostoma richardsiae TaxID=41990 RepID=A0AA38RSU6_9PEZI|nr:hypothetical protein NKR23_g7823 [Pleurostoma richardsiae]